MEMSKIEIQTDELTHQYMWYTRLLGEKGVRRYMCFDHNTYGYTKNFGVIFEHKDNLQAYGESKALSQALLYLVQFNLNGMPVPAKIVLVDQTNSEIHIHKTEDYKEVVNDIDKYASMRASKGIDGFVLKSEPQVIKYSFEDDDTIEPIKRLIKDKPEFCKVDITTKNVYGWANYYYKNAEAEEPCYNEKGEPLQYPDGKYKTRKIYNQKAEKKAFFRELRHPVGTLKYKINDWKGSESDFALIMDMLNDPTTKKKLGAFYTPDQYCELGHNLLKDAIKRVPDGCDYVIIDRCAGTGNLEGVLSDEELSHCIVNTYELKEWLVLKDRIGHKVRHIFPELPPEDYAGDYSELLNGEGFLDGSDAFSKEFNDQLEEVIEKTKKAEKVIRIFYENPPYAETTNVEFQKKGIGKKHSTWKKSYAVEKMKNDPMVKGVASNDMANVFIWSAFNLLMKNKEDSYVIYSPIKYWKSQKIIDRVFVRGYAVNRKYFHATSEACITLSLWLNEKETEEQELKYDAYNISAIGLEQEGTLIAKQVHSLFSKKYYRMSFDPELILKDQLGTACALNGSETDKSENKWSVNRNTYNNTLGYLVVKESGFNYPGLQCSLTSAPMYNGNGFVLQNETYLYKLPIFIAGRYIDNCRDWKAVSFVMKSGDGAEEYLADCKKIKDDPLCDLNVYLHRCLIYTGLTHYNHQRSFTASTGKEYRTELCFSNENTLASKELKAFIDSGYALTEEEQSLFEQWNRIVKRAKQKTEYKEREGVEWNDNYNYGLFQIDQEINISVSSTNPLTGKEKKLPLDGELNNMIKDFKKQLKNYYLNNLTDMLFKYQFLK